MNETSYEFESTRSAIAAKITAGLSRAKSILFAKSSCISSFTFFLRKRYNSILSDSVSGLSAGFAVSGWIFSTHSLTVVSLIASFFATSDTE